MNKLLIALSLGTAMAMALMQPLVAQDAVKQQAEPAAGEKTQLTEEERAAKKAERERTGTWWHADGVATAVQLSAAQIAQMDELRAQDKQRRSVTEGNRRELKNRIEAAFQQGDLNGARKAIAELDQLESSEYTLKLEVLGLLSTQQMALLQEKYPGVLTEDWRRNTRRLVEKSKDRKGGDGEGGKGKGDKHGPKGEKSAKESEKSAADG